MKSVKGAKRSFKKHVLGTVAASSTAMISTAAIAGLVSTSVVLYAAVGDTASGGSRLKWLEPIVSVLGIGSISSSMPLISTVGSGTSTTDTRKVKQTGGTPTTAKPMKLGINLDGTPYYSGGRAFSNLLAGSNWTYTQANGTYGDVPASYLDGNRNVVRLGAGETVVRPFNIPTKAYTGASVDITCRWLGTGSVQIWGSPVRNLKINAQSATFTFVPVNKEYGQFRYSNINPSNPLRQIDCRESDADPTALFDPTFLAEVKKYNTMRFMKWTWAVEANLPVTWSNRTKAGDGIIFGPDSVPVEYMVELANQTGTNPWFCIPWNADDDYIRQFATYVRDHLNPNLTAHIENSNEVWNWIYPVTTQAADEGMARGYSEERGHAMLRRYAERTGEIMDIWTSVFAGKMSRIVRVAASQNWDYAASVELSFKDLNKKVDAVASAPYFGVLLTAGRLSTNAELDPWFADLQSRIVDDTLGEAKKIQTVASGYGLRYITYEAGQHVLAQGGDAAILGQVQRDPRMSAAYTAYLTKWRNQLGDLMMLFSDYSPIAANGAFGMQEYVGQPLTEAPKKNAVELFQRSYPVR